MVPRPLPLQQGIPSAAAMTLSFSPHLHLAPVLPLRRHRSPDPPDPHAGAPRGLCRKCQSLLPSASPLLMVIPLLPPPIEKRSLYIAGLSMPSAEAISPYR